MLQAKIKINQTWTQLKGVKTSPRKIYRLSHLLKGGNKKIRRKSRLIGEDLRISNTFLQNSRKSLKNSMRKREK